MNWYRRLQLWFRHSPYAKPTVYLVLFFFLSSVAIWLFELGRNEQFGNIFDGIWWAIITFSTTGYGDKVPQTAGGRVVAIVTVVIGIGATSLLSGALASWLVDRNTKARRGLMDFRKLKDHLVVCGWKGDMKDVLLSILRVSPDLAADQIVVVSNVESERIEELKEDENLTGLRFVRGDYFAEASLRRANIEAARKVLILSDTLESHAVSEVDSKTVLTVLTIKAIARDVYVAAEVLDRKFESYLRTAMCDEVIFSLDFSRQILATTSATNGMSHIIHDLLSQSSGSGRLVTEAVPPETVDTTFGDLRAHFSHPGRILIGLLENTGSPNHMKVQALREAQKTSDVSQLINNLQKVKGLEVNKPIFLPSDDHPIPRYARAIVLERV